MKTTVSKTSLKNQFSIAIYRDGKKWVAHNLTIDIVGVGVSRKAAFDEMKALTESQISFAVRNGTPEAINHPAPERFWKMLAKRINADFIGQLVSHTHSVTSSELKKLFASSQVYDLGAKSRFA